MLHAGRTQLDLCSSALAQRSVSRMRRDGRGTARPRLSPGALRRDRRDLGDDAEPCTTLLSAPTVRDSDIENSLDGPRVLVP